MGCQEKPTSHRGATDPPFPALYRAAAACPALPRLRPMVSREEGVFNISMGGGFLDRPGACRNVGNPGRSVRRFCQVEGFSALSMAGGFRDQPAGCWKGGKAAPRVLVFVTPRAFMPPAWRLPKSQRKRAPSRMPYTRLSNARNIRQPMPDIQQLRPQTRDSRFHLLRRP